MRPKQRDSIPISTIIHDQLYTEDNLTAVYLFGSQAADRSHPLSDVDVAILFQTGLGRRQRFQQLLIIGTKLESALPVAVDVIDLRRAPPLLRFQVLKHGRLVFEHDRTERCLFEMYAMQTYYDVKPYLDYQRTQIIRRIQEEGLGHGYNGHHHALDKIRLLRETLARPADSGT